MGEDAVPHVAVLRVESAFDLLTMTEVEHAHDPRFDLKAIPASAHEAQRTDMLVIPEDVMLP